MNLDIDVSHLELPAAEQRKLLFKMIHGTERWYLQSKLREFDVTGRTRLYNIFGWGGQSFYQDDRGWEAIQNERSENQMRAVDEILSQTNFLDWVKPYIKNYTIRNFLNLCSESKIDLRGFDIRIVEEQTHES